MLTKKEHTLTMLLAGMVVFTFMCGAGNVFLYTLFGRNHLWHAGLHYAIFLYSIISLVKQRKRVLETARTRQDLIDTQQFVITELKTSK